jgi:hypothetical protein
MPSIAQIAHAMRQIFHERAHIAARLNALVQRERCISGPQFVQTLVGGFLADPHASYETLAEFAADLGAPLSPQALAKRVAQPAVATLADLLAFTTQQVMVADPLAASLLNRFAAVTVEDSTVISLPDALAHCFPGCGGNRNNANAAIKAQFRWELRSGRLDGPLLHEGRAADRAISFRARVAPGTLRLRDLGYWQLDDLKRDSDDGRFWLMRLKPGTAVFLPCGTRHDLLSLLAASSEDTARWTVELGVQQRVKSRLFARRVSAEEEGKRQRRAAATAKRKGRTLSQAAEARCSWDVLVTNVPEELLSAAEAWVLYQLRWQIEIVFPQVTKADVCAGFGGRDDVADLHLLVGDNHTVDEQFDQLASLRKGRLFQPHLEASTQRLDCWDSLACLQQLLTVVRNLPRLTFQIVPLVNEFALAPLKLRQLHGFGQVGREQALALTLQTAQGLLNGGLTLV